MHAPGASRNGAVVADVDGLGQLSAVPRIADVVVTGAGFTWTGVLVQLVAASFVLREYVSTHAAGLRRSS